MSRLARGTVRRRMRIARSTQAALARGGFESFKVRLAMTSPNDPWQEGPMGVIQSCLCRHPLSLPPAPDLSRKPVFGGR